MKLPLLLVLAGCCIQLSLRAQSLAVNTDGTSADISAILDVKSTLKGLLVPRMSSAQRLAISTPANGLLVYDIDINSFYYYNGVFWNNISPVNNWLLTGNSGINPATNFRYTSYDCKLKCNVV